MVAYPAILSGEVRAIKALSVLSQYLQTSHCGVIQRGGHVHAGTPVNLRPVKDPWKHITVLFMCNLNCFHGQ